MQIKKEYIPNILTSSRILLTPVFLYFLFSDFSHSKLIALVIFMVASITDAFDGFYARKHNIVSRFGTFFDPLADKLLVLSAFYGFMFIPILTTEVKLWMIILISFRDIVVTLLRMIMEYKGITMVTSKVSKIKTALQLSTIIFILTYLILFAYNISYWQLFSEEFILIYDESFSILYFCMTATTLVTFYTGLHYFYYNYKTLGQSLFQK
jgi:CDP-diacylglycerol--glycerol-3-phosphate 3-phosphatidyltransferase|tara:strand:- start:2191 stop:2820 length:630 start_codon:yes stop_codon:yes gene_type:complete